MGSFSTTMTPPMHHVSCSFFGETSNHPGESAPLQPRFGSLKLLPFPKTKITFEREEILDHRWDSGKYDKAADGNWENCVRSQGAHFEGDWGIIVPCTMFLVSCVFINKCLYSYYTAGYLMNRPHIFIFFMAFDSQGAFQKDWPNQTSFNNAYKFHYHTLAWNNLFKTFLLITLVMKWNLDVLIASLRLLWLQKRRLQMVPWLHITVCLKA